MEAPLQTRGASQAKTEQLHMDSNLATMVWGPIAVVVWRGVANTFGNQQVFLAGQHALQSFPRGVAVVGVVEATHKVPDAATRAHSAQINDQLAGVGVVGFAGVLPLPGFAGAWARGVVTGITLLSRQRYLFQVYRYESEAVRWLGKLLVHKSGLSIDIEAGGRAIEAFRQHYAKHLGIHEA